MKNSIKLAAIGDIMCGDSFFSIGTGGGSKIDVYGKSFLRADICDFLQQHDIVMCNLESVLSDLERNDNSIRSLHMRGRSKYASYLHDWGINIANVANNHILEHGIDAAVDTVKNLQSAGIKVVGAGGLGAFKAGMQTVTISKSEDIVIIGACFHNGPYSFNGGLEKEPLLQAIRTLSTMGNTVIVTVHWGDDYMVRPSLEQRRIGAELRVAGATAVIGHHPHVIQGIDYEEGHIIAYSLGNFIFNTLQIDTRWSVILSLEIKNKKVLRWDYHVVDIDADYRPLFAKGEKKKLLQQKVIKRCEMIKGCYEDQAYRSQYDAERKVIIANARRRLKRTLLKRVLSYKPKFLIQILSRPIKRRIGLW